MSILKYFKSELFLQEILFFSIAQFAGVFIVKRVGELLLVSEIPLKQISLMDFLLFFLVSTAVVFLLSSKSKVSGFLMNIFFIFTLFLGANLFLSIFVNSASAFYFSVALIVARFLFPTILLHNILFLVSVVVFSSVLALQINPTTIIILLAALSVYDVVSVYLTRHMVKMAKAMIERHVIFGFIIPEKIKYNLWGVQKAQPGAGVIFLGGGDIGLPLFLVSNVAFFSAMQGIVVAIFAILGIILSYYLFISQKLKKPMPALPPISMMTILGYVLVKIIWG